MRLLNNIQLMPFVRFIWNSSFLQKEWGHKINRILNLYALTEYEMVKQRKRKCATYHLTPQKFDKQIDRIETDGLVWLPIQWTKNYEGFSHYHLPTTPGDPESSCYGVLSWDKEFADAFRGASNTFDVDHATIGHLLGFPDCCISFFNNVWCKGYCDPIWQAAMNTESKEIISDTHVRVHGSPFTYQHLRYCGFRITSHLPHSFDCQATIEVGKQWLEVMRSIDSEGTDILLEVLSMPSTWDCYRGIAQIDTPIFTIITNSMPTASSPRVCGGATDAIAFRAQ